METDPEPHGCLFWACLSLLTLLIIKPQLTIRKHLIRKEKKRLTRRGERVETAARNNCVVLVYLQKGSDKILATIEDLRPSNKHQTGSSTNRKHVSANA